MRGSDDEELFHREVSIEVVFIDDADPGAESIE
jgi:hypothetical protein